MTSGTAALFSKIYLPTTASCCVPRPRLVERLVQGQAHPFVLMNAPSGYGKTTLLKQWMASARTPLKYWKITARENLPEDFWRMRIEHLKTLLPQTWKLYNQQNALSTGENYTELLTYLLDELAALPPGEPPVTLILDDFDLIDCPAIHKSLGFLLDSLPRSLRFVITSGLELPETLKRLSILGNVFTISAEELGFNGKEIRQYFAIRYSLGLSEKDAHDVARRSRGRAAALDQSLLDIATTQRLMNWLPERRSWRESGTSVASRPTAEVKSQSTLVGPFVSEEPIYTDLARLMVATSLYQRGELKTAEEVLQQQDGPSGPVEHPEGHLAAELSLGQLQAASGDLAEAARCAYRVLQKAGDKQPYEALAARILLSSILREWNQLGRAEYYLRCALTAAEKNGQDLYLHGGYAELGLLVWERRPTDPEIEKLFEKQYRLAVLLGDLQGLRTAHALHARIAARRDDAGTIQAWRRIYKLSSLDEVSFQREAEYVTLARILVDEDKDGAIQALHLLQRLAELAEGQQREGSLVDIHLLRALAYQVTGEIGQALEALETALEYGSRGRYIRTFLDEEIRIKKLLQTLASLGERPRLEQYLPDLLARFAAPGAGQSALAYASGSLCRTAPRIAMFEGLNLVLMGLLDRSVNQSLNGKQAAKKI